jgi:replicative DNA helicase
VTAIVAKNRNGKRGVEVLLQFAGEYASLRNLTTQTPPAARAA